MSDGGDNTPTGHDDSEVIYDLPATRFLIAPMTSPTVSKSSLASLELYEICTSNFSSRSKIISTAPNESIPISSSLSVMLTLRFSAGTLFAIIAITSAATSSMPHHPWLSLVLLYQDGLRWQSTQEGQGSDRSICNSIKAD